MQVVADPLHNAPDLLGQFGRENGLHGADGSAGAGEGADALNLVKIRQKGPGGGAGDLFGLPDLPHHAPKECRNQCPQLVCQPGQAVQGLAQHRIQRPCNGGQGLGDGVFQPGEGAFQGDDLPLQRHRIKGLPQGLPGGPGLGLHGPQLPFQAGQPLQTGNFQINDHGLSPAFPARRLSRR